ncbi:MULTISPECIES: ABC transporter ATP-binding protein [unclassified Hoeflea]|uniref:ABC transporter ATP-binding protein n=1 Tax=unclassified Hoeflea TaxID=2614931 RepID=UPI0039902728
MLEIRDLNVFRGATHVLKDVAFGVDEGSLVALIGANGAGKSTTLLTLSGLLPARSGSILFTAGGTTIDLVQSSSEKIVRAGLVQCPEGRQVFQSLSVAENLAMGAYTQSDKAAIKQTTEHVYELFPILSERAHIAAGSLSGGEQMMLAIGRALLAKPKMLLLDEPSLGLAPQIVEKIFDIIEQLKATGVTILLIEQNAAMALDIADRAHVMENGRIVLSGTGAELAQNDRVRQSYLGVAA